MLTADASDVCLLAVVAARRRRSTILQTERLIAFLDHRPLFRGHTLLVPKLHIRLLSDLPADWAQEFLTTAQRLERAVEDGLGADGSMILVNNVVSQSVPHLHLHVIPRNKETACGSGSVRGIHMTLPTRPRPTRKRSGPPCRKRGLPPPWLPQRQEFHSRLRGDIDT